jgi:hypothetical protein
MGLDVLAENGAARPDDDESVLAEADRIVNGPRRESYGHPLDDYTRTAAMWSGFLGVEISAEDALAMMVMLKLSREKHRPGRDNRVDAAGYVACLDLTVNERTRRG